jgi:DNA-directed RNA polymerase I subunit RPA49
MAEEPRKKRKLSHESQESLLPAISPKQAPIPRVSSTLVPKVSPPVIGMVHVQFCFSISTLTQVRIVATSSSIRVPEDVQFHSYAKLQRATASRRRHEQRPAPELLLYSASHKTMDYTAREDGPNDMSSLLNHFLCVYDPRTGKLDVVQAKRMVIRGGARSSAVQDGDEHSQTRVRSPAHATLILWLTFSLQTHVQRRQELGEAFGTKKARKAIVERSQNAISSGLKGTNGTLAASDMALMDRIKEKAVQVPTQADLQASINASRPIPQGNFEADEVQDVYIPEVFIGTGVLILIPVRDWQEACDKDEGLQLASRFVANRVVREAAKPDSVLRLRRLRYLLLLIVFWRTTSKGKGHGVWRIAKREKLRESMAPAPEHVLESIRRQFSEQGEMRKLQVDLLMTHCAALALVIDGFEMDIFDLREDLKLEEKEMSQYVAELGGTTEVKKMDGRRARIAKLRLPLQFPKLRVPIRRRQ